MKKSILTLGSTVGLLTALNVSSAGAATITYDITTAFSGNSAYTASLIATFTDNTEPEGGVFIEMQFVTAPNQGDYADAWYFNLDPALDATQLTATYQSGTSATFDSTNSIASQSHDTDFKADGDGYFDLLFKFDKVGPNGNLALGDSSKYLLTGITGLDVTDFLFVSIDGTTGKNGFYAAANVQGGAWLADGDGPREQLDPSPVPEPGSMTLLGSGLLAAAAAIRRRRNNS